MPEYTRVHRLLKILTLIQGRSGWTPERLAEECGKSPRTIFRDLKELQKVGIPIEFDQSAKTYRITGDFFLPPVQLTPSEALSLVVLCEQIAEPEQIAFTKPAWQALAKIEAAMPASVREEVARLSEAVVVRTASSVPGGGFDDTYSVIRSAIAERKALLCRYESLRHESDSEEFDFEPYALFFCVRAWYAVGYHAGRDALRTLKVTRFASVKTTNRPYVIPEDFSLDDHLGNAWRMMKGDAEYRVELLFDADFAETISDTIWHRTQQIDLNEDGSATFTCTVDGLDEIVWWVLSMGPHCRVISPPELAQRVRDAAERVVGLYGPGAAPST